MSDRLKIEKGPFGAQFIEAPEGGHGKDGQVKKAGFWGREVKVQGQKMNAGSLVDFLNTQVAPKKQLKKGWFFGLGGSSNKEIKNLFNEIYAMDPLADQRIEETKKSFVLLNPVNEYNPNRYKGQKMADIQEEFDGSDFKAVFLTKMKEFEGIFLMSSDRVEGFAPRLYICLSEDNPTALDSLIDEAIKKLAELDMPVPEIFCCNSDDFAPMEAWQKLNGREQLIAEKTNADSI